MHKHRDKDALIDCVIKAGEIGKDGHFLDNSFKVIEVAKHNVSYYDFQEWLGSAACQKRVKELMKRGEKRFGKDHWKKYRVGCFCIPVTLCSAED